VWPLAVPRLPEALLLRTLSSRGITNSHTLIRYLYPQREWHNPLNSAGWITCTDYMNDMIALRPPHPNGCGWFAPTRGHPAWLLSALRVIQCLLDTLWPWTAHDRGLQAYCDVYWRLIDACLTQRAPTWAWFLRVTAPAAVRTPGAHDIHAGHRLFTHFHVISTPLKNMTPAAERHDVALCLMRRAWAPKTQPKAFAERIRKLCSEIPNKPERDACCRLLLRLVLVGRLGYYRSQSFPQLQQDPAAVRMQLLRQWYDLDTQVVTTWTDVQAAAAAAATAASTTEEAYLLDCVTAYLTDYIDTYPALSGFVKRRFPKWPRGVGTSAGASCWIPCETLNYLRACMLSSKPLRKALNSVASHQRDDDLELHTQCVLDQVAQVPGATQVTALSVLAKWHGVPLIPVLQLADQLDLFQQGILTKSRVRKLLISAWLPNKTLMEWLCVIVHEWSTRALVHVVPAPYAWTINVADHFRQLEEREHVTVSPMIDCFVFCPSCQRICSITTAPIAPTRRRRTATKRQDTGAVTGGAAAGFEHVVVDVDAGGQLVCASRKSGLTATTCATTILKQVHLTGLLLHYHDRVYLLCPQPRCGRLMLFEPGVCKYTEHGPCCSVCMQTAASDIADSKDTTSGAEDSDTKDDHDCIESITHVNEKLFDTDDDNDDVNNNDT
jgi:hypothetical protein